MGITEKGKKGFQAIPKEELKTRRTYLYLTREEKMKLMTYALEHNESQSNIIRECIKHIIE